MEYPLLKQLSVIKWLKITGWLLIIALSIKFFLQDFLHFFTSPQITRKLFGDVSTIILLHICAGLPALLLGPFQIWTKFRNRHRKVHRWMGRIYLSGVLIAAPAAFYIAIFSSQSVTAMSGLAARTGLATLSIFWLFSGAMAYYYIKNGKKLLHRQWMIRNYTMTLFFVLVRLLTTSLTGLGFNIVHIFGAVIWFSWAPPLLIEEYIFSIKNQKRFKTVNVS